MKKGPATLRPKGHVETNRTEQIGFVAAFVIINAFTLAALITQKPPIDVAANIILGALSLTCFVSAAIFICDEDVEG